MSIIANFALVTHFDPLPHSPSTRYCCSVGKGMQWMLVSQTTGDTTKPCFSHLAGCVEMATKPPVLTKCFHNNTFNYLLTTSRPTSKQQLDTGGTNALALFHTD
eukprot:TRINITY_DN9000_c1_g1_i3.p1 TRINITY_DN9000_c1_g1~~TRINITY_DN9000_c1_g1_i3.p1  ORF type:complete len:104 (-),score=2.00 TRINITY_DN9000_c1_g1_i3:126-437(-)